MANFGIRSKFMAFAATCSVIAALVGFICIGYLKNTNEAMNKVSVDATALINHLSSDKVHSNLRGDVYLALVAASRKDEQALQSAISRIEYNASESRRLLEENIALGLPANITSSMEQASPSLEKYIGSAADVIQLSSMDLDVAFNDLPNFEAAYAKLNQVQTELTSLISEDGKAHKDSTNALVESATLVITACVVVSFFLMAFFASLVAGYITSPILQASKLAERISEGHLDNTVTITTKDETATLLLALSQMSGKLKDIVQQVSLSSSEITRGSQEIANGNSDLSKRSEEQATSLRTTAASVTEMTSNVKVAAASAESANTLSKQTQDHAQKGGEIVKRAIASMGEINDSSKKIADIIGMINEIAFQTNLLALNAAVEAARAGEQGRGFAVVAQEVRSLAQRSATAADEIKKLIEDSLNKIGDGSKSVEDTGEALRQIQESVGRVTGSVADINNSSQEQALGIERVNQNISNIDSATNANLALVDSAATTSESMAAEARRMYELMQFFKLSKSA